MPRVGSGLRPARRALARRATSIAFAACVALASSVGAVELGDDFEPIDGKTNQVDITLAVSNPQTSYVTDCDGETSYVAGTYDTLRSTFTLEDGVLCGTDVSFFLLFGVERIAVYLGPSAEAVTSGFGSFEPTTGAIGPDGVATFEGLRALFEAEVSIGATPSHVLAPVDGDFTAVVAVDGGTGRLALRALEGTVEGTVDPDGPGGGLPPQVVTGALTLNLESVAPLSPFAIAARDFEAGDLDGWDIVVGVR